MIASAGIADAVAIIGMAVDFFERLDSVGMIVIAHWGVPFKRRHSHMLEDIKFSSPSEAFATATPSLP